MNEAEQTWPENNPHLAAFPRPSGPKPLPLPWILLGMFTDFRICWRRIKILRLTGLMENTGLGQKILFTKGL